MTDYELHTGAAFEPPQIDRWRPPPGEITWIDADVASVSTSGPALVVSVDFTQPRARGREQVVVVRLSDNRGYFPTRFPEYADPQENLAVSATVQVPMSGTVEEVVLVVPYITMPRDSGGLSEIEIAVHEPAGVVTAINYHHLDLPDDFDRVPDMLSVITHTLVALARTQGKLTRDEVRVIRKLLVSNFQLDDLGDQALRRILKVAVKAEHSPVTLAEAIDHAVPPENETRLVNLVYAAAEADGSITDPEQRFITDLLERCGIHDHKRYGPEHLRPAYEELELDPGAGLDAVKKAYRKLVRDYHPDRVQGLAKGFRDFAHEKTSRLNEAYSTLRGALDDAYVETEVELED